MEPENPIVSPICDLIVEMVKLGNGDNLMKSIALELKRRGYVVMIKQDWETSVVYIKLAKINGGE